MGVGIVIAMLGLGAVNSLAVFFIPHDLHVAASWIGAVTGSVGAGAIAGALLTAAVTRWLRPSQLFWMSLAAAGRVDRLLPRHLPSPGDRVCRLLGVAVGVLNAALSPTFWRRRHPAAPPGQRGDQPDATARLQHLAGAGPRPRGAQSCEGLSAVVAGFMFGPYDTVFGVAGLLFLIARAVSVAPLRAAGKSAAAAAAGACRNTGQRGRRHRVS